jgi:hypothetical protein
MEPKESTQFILEKMATAVEWTKLQSWMESNPYKTASLPRAHIGESIHFEQDAEDTKGWKTVHVSPATPLSVVLYAQDPLYSSSTQGTRKSLLRDETTDMQEKATLHLKGRQWPVRKTAEGIAGVGLEEERHSLWTEHGWRALCALRNCQLIVLNQKSKEMTFYPEDVRTWSEEVETLFLDTAARCLYVPPKGLLLKKWIQEQEAASWAITWPLPDGSMDELKALADKVGVPSVKMTKDVLRRRIGEMQSLQLLEKWQPLL